MVEHRIFIHRDTLLVDFSIEISNAKNSRMQDGVGFGLASCHATTLEL